MSEINFVNQKVVLFVDVTKKISLQIGSRLIRSKNPWREMYGQVNKKTKNSRKMIKWHGHGMSKMIKMLKDNILTLIKIFNLIQVTMVPQYGKWSMKIIVSQKQMANTHKNINNNNANNKKYSTKYYQVYIQVYQVISQGFIKTCQQGCSSGPIWGKKEKDFSLTGSNIKIEF